MSREQIADIFRIRWSHYSTRFADVDSNSLEICFWTKGVWVKKVERGIGQSAGLNVDVDSSQKTLAQRTPQYELP